MRGDSVLFIAYFFSILISVCVTKGIYFTDDEKQHGFVAHREVIFSHKTKSSASASSNCSIDLRDSMPACVQQGEDWCWATGLSEFI